MAKPMVNEDFENVVLQNEQKDLLVELVELSRAVPPDRRDKFCVMKTMGGTWVLHPPSNRKIEVYEGDIEALADVGLLRLTYGSRGTPLFDITPVAYRYYDWLKLKLGEPAQAVEGEIRRYLDSMTFRTRHPQAFDTWARAAEQLWEADSTSQFTSIGHACREAMQHFATSLAQTQKLDRIDPDPAHTVARIRSVLNRMASERSHAEQTFLGALLSYWGSAIDLVQRQEHGALKEGRDLLWEDARRAVFQTAVVMFEIDRACR